MGSNAPRRILLPPAAEDEVIRLGAQDTHHLLNVLRMRPGDPIAAVTTDGREFAAVIDSVEAGRASIRICGRVGAVSTCACANVTLCFSPPRSQRSDWLVEKAVELGASRLQAVIFERTQGYIEKTVRTRISRWTRLAKEACEQSRRTGVPAIGEPLKWAAFLDEVGGMREPEPRKLLAHTGGRAAPILDELTASPPQRDAAIVIAVGPEGGLTEREVAAGVAAGFRLISLGPTTLRTETAAVAALSVVIAASQTHWGRG